MAASGDRVVDQVVVLEEGTRYALTANTAPDDTDRVHTAVIIEVE